MIPIFLIKKHGRLVQIHKRWEEIHILKKEKKANDVR